MRLLKGRDLCALPTALFPALRAGLGPEEALRLVVEKKNPFFRQAKCQDKQPTAEGR